MLRVFPSLGLILPTLAGLLFVADAARAGGLVGYRNDAKQALIVQSTIVVNNIVRRSKPQLLYPGEMAVDGLNATGVRRIVIFDPKKPSTVLHQEDVNVTTDVLLSIQIDSTIMVKDKPAAPQFKLVPTAIPTQAVRTSGPSSPTTTKKK